jgi:hypothetical protein
MVEENTMAIFDACLENEPHSAIVFFGFLLFVCLLCVASEGGFRGETDLF